MAIHRTPEEKFEEVQTEIYKTQVLSEPTLANAEAATTAHDDSELVYRGRRFRVPPVPYRRAVELLVLDQELRRILVQESTQENLQHGLEVTKEILTLYHSLVRPVGWWDKLLWKIRGNPFWDAEFQEINVLTNFFCSARMMCNITWSTSSRAPQWLRTTWPMKSPFLRPAILAISPMDSPVVGDIFDLE